MHAARNASCNAKAGYGVTGFGCGVFGVAVHGLYGVAYQKVMKILQSYCVCRKGQKPMVCGKPS